MKKGMVMAMKGNVVKELVEMLGSIQKVLFEVKEQLQDQDRRISQIEEYLAAEFVAWCAASVEEEKNG